MPDFFALDSYPLSILAASQRTSFFHSSSPFDSEGRFETFTEKCKSTAEAGTHACTHILGNNLEISLAVCQH